jgi:hypothetical protein
MDDAIEFVETTIMEGEGCEARAIEGAIRADDGGAEVFCDVAIDFVAGLHHVAGDGVGFKDMEAVLAEDGGDGRFATAEAAGESYAQHTSPIDTPRKRMRRSPMRL